MDFTSTYFSSEHLHGMRFLKNFTTVCSSMFWVNKIILLQLKRAWVCLNLTAAYCSKNLAKIALSRALIRSSSSTYCVPIRKRKDKKQAAKVRRWARFAMQVSHWRLHHNILGIASECIQDNMSQACCLVKPRLAASFLASCVSRTEILPCFPPLRKSLTRCYAL